MWGWRKEGCDTLGQTHVKALGNLADLSLFAADSCGKDALRQPMQNCWVGLGEAQSSCIHFAPWLHAQEGLLTGAGVGRLPPAQGLCGGRHGACGKGSPWIFPNNLEDTHRAWPPPIGWHRHLAGPFVTFLTVMHWGRASPAQQGEMAPHKPAGVLGGGEQGSAEEMWLL